MQAADFKAQEQDPFAEKLQLSFGRREVSPYVNRIRLMWAQMREAVIAHFPDNPNQAIDIETYMAEVEDKYVTDAYHSLSIEGYRVTRELIDLVRSGQWQADGSDENKKHLDAMAAKGYWDAFLQVKKAVRVVLEGKNPGVMQKSSGLIIPIWSADNRILCLLRSFWRRCLKPQIEFPKIQKTDKTEKVLRLNPSRTASSD